MSKLKFKLTASGQVSCYMKKVYENKDVYEGDFLNKTRHGQGIFIHCQATRRYEGGFENDLFSGKGLLMYDDPEQKYLKYEGQFKSGMFHGLGTLHFRNGDVYTGSFQMSLYSGQGELIEIIPNNTSTVNKTNTNTNTNISSSASSSGPVAPNKKMIIYNGTWHRGYPKGKMKIVNLKSGDMYEGDVDKYYHGFGRVEYRGGTLGWYEGDFRRGEFHGKGIRVYMDGNRYEGQFCDGQINGSGTMMYINGDKYSGCWENGFFQGEGTLVYANGDRFEGNFQKGKFLGEGVFTYAAPNRNKAKSNNNKNDMNNSTSYIGISKVKSKESAASAGAADASPSSSEFGKYDGEYNNKAIGNKLNGKLVYLADGLRHGLGHRVYSNGTEYYGEWKEDRCDGIGVLISIFDEALAKYHSNSNNINSSRAAFGERVDEFDGSADAFVNRRTPLTVSSSVIHDTSSNFHSATSGNAQTNISGIGSINPLQSVLTKLKYEGGFVNGMRSGFGQEEFGNCNGRPYVCPLGHRHTGAYKGLSKYEGEYRHNQFHGIGRFQCEDGRLYIGSFKQGRRSGRGTQTYVIQDRDISSQLIVNRLIEYSGEWVNNVREGFGRAVYANGDAVEGRFSGGRPHGVVKYFFGRKPINLTPYYEDGTNSSGQLKNGKINKKDSKPTSTIYESKNMRIQKSKTISVASASHSKVSKGSSNIDRVSASLTSVKSGSRVSKGDNKKSIAAAKNIFVTDDASSRPKSMSSLYNGYHYEQDNDDDDWSFSFTRSEDGSMNIDDNVARVRLVQYECGRRVKWLKSKESEDDFDSDSFSTIF